MRFRASTVSTHIHIIIKITLLQDTSKADKLTEAYDLFQRLALAAELAMVDMRHHGDYAARAGAMWKKSRAFAHRILGYLYAELELEAGVRTGPALPRSALGAGLRCAAHSVHRDVRDFVILQSAQRTVNFYVEHFDWLLGA